MSSSNKAPLLLVALLLLVGVVAFFVLGNEAAPGDGEGGLGPAVVEVAAAPKLSMGTDSVSLPSAREGVEAMGPSTVLWPLEIELRLIEPGDVPKPDEGPVLGAGANAILKGRIGDRKDRGAQATITFVEGANSGRVLTTDAEGHFGATDLYPGLSIVEVAGHGLVGARREVRLRQRRETLLNLGFGLLGTVQGQVLDETGAPVVGATAIIDGHRDQTDDNGFFYLPSLASGLSFLELEKPGYASHRENVAITANSVTPPDRLKYVLKQGSTLLLSVSGNVGGPGPVEVWLSPGNSKQARTFPFYKLNPIELQPGESREIPDLPKELVQLRAFRSGASVYPPTRNANLRASKHLPVQFELRDTPRIFGRVYADKLPVAQARVVLEAPDQVQAALRHYRQPATYLESSILPMPPGARQEVRTNGLGEFTLSSWDDNSAARYLWAESFDGQQFGIRLIEADDLEVSLDLEPRAKGTGKLTLDVGERYQGLPVRWSMNGEPGTPFDLAPGEPLTFEGLREGRWSVEVRWYATELLGESSVEVDAAGAELGLSLPEGALNGQSRDAWERAGRDWPLDSF
ncbi:MAG: carboxypeptidase-like regulatory domain-containing protein [Planctomycetota bacterium]|nr:carboxypeptidase-like regulatory domain-containing protein [Planctomycetota bacterium]